MEPILDKKIRRGCDRPRPHRQASRNYQQNPPEISGVSSGLASGCGASIHAAFIADKIVTGN